VVTNTCLNLRLKVPPRDMNHVKECTLLIFIGLAHIEHDGGRIRCQLCLSTSGIDLHNLGFCGGEKVTKRSHG
jgi:hypothetical protein